ncbi:hypothetical protein EV182_005738, partial [Spiromyces aspiralis]
MYSVRFPRTDRKGMGEIPKEVKHIIRVLLNPEEAKRPDIGDVLGYVLECRQPMVMPPVTSIHFEVNEPSSSSRPMSPSKFNLGATNCEPDRPGSTEVHTSEECEGSGRQQRAAVVTASPQIRRLHTYPKAKWLDEYEGHSDSEPVEGRMLQDAKHDGERKRAKPPGTPRDQPQGQVPSARDRLVEQNNGRRSSDVAPKMLAIDAPSSYRLRRFAVMAIRVAIIGLK